MAFQRFQKKQDGGGKPVMSIAFSAKQGQSYVKGPSTGVWVNENGGPAFRGSLSPEKVAELAEFFANMAEAGLGGQVSVFDNSEQQRAPARPAFRKPSPATFGGSTAGIRKSNPFKVDPDGDDSQEEPTF